MNDLNTHLDVQKVIGENEKVKWLAVKGKVKVIVAIVNKETAEVESYLMVSPWN